MRRVRTEPQNYVIVTNRRKALLRPEWRQFGRQGYNRQRRNCQPRHHQRELAYKILTCTNDLIRDAGCVERIDS